MKATIIRFNAKLARVNLKFNHLKDHNFCDNFRDCGSLCYFCGAEIQTTKHYFSERKNIYVIYTTIISFDEILILINIMLISYYIILINIVQLQSLDVSY